MNDYVLYASYSHWGMFETKTFWSDKYGIWLNMILIRPEWAAVIIEV